MPRLPIPHTPTPRITRRPGRPAGRTVSDGVIADRATLLAAAERVIRAEGPEVSLAAIAAEADVTKPVLYREVGDRNALVNALAERLVGRMTSNVERLVTPASTPHDALRRLVSGYLENAARDRNLYVYVTLNGTGADPVRQSLVLADTTAERFAAGIAADRAERGADPAVATTWAYGLIGALHYVTLWWLRDRAADVEEVTDQLTALLWSGMRIEKVRRRAPPRRKAVAKPS